MRPVGPDTGSPRAGQLPSPNPGAESAGQTRSPCADALPGTCSQLPHRPPWAHPGPSGPRTQLPEAERLTVQLALRPLHHKLLPLGPDSSENSSFHFNQSFTMAVICGFNEQAAI